MPGHFDKEGGLAVGILSAAAERGGELAIRPLKALLFFPDVEGTHTVRPHPAASFHRILLLEPDSASPYP